MLTRESDGSEITYFDIAAEYAAAGRVDVIGHLLQLVGESIMKFGQEHPELREPLDERMKELHEEKENP